MMLFTIGYARFDVVELPSSEPSIDSKARTAITYVTSLLALVFMAAFTATLIILLVHIQCRRNHSNHGTLMQTPEANYSTVGPPLPPIRIERNMSYEERVIQTDNHSIVGHDTSNSFVEANDNADLDNTLQSQLVLNESVETGSVPTNTSIVNMLLLQRSDTETLPPECESTTSDSESITERVAYLHNTQNALDNVTIPRDHGIQTQENIAYDRQFELQDLGSSNEETARMVANPAYGTDVAIVPEVQTQTNLAYRL